MAFVGFFIGFLLGILCAWLFEGHIILECKRLQEDTRRVQAEAREILESLQPPPQPVNLKDKT